MIEADASSMGTSWLGTASRPRVAITADRPSSNGIPAATAAPKTISRMPSVSGTAVNSARWKSDAIVSSTDFSPLAEPNPSTVKPGLAASMSSTVVRIGSIRSTAATPVSSSSYCTSTAWPSGETSFGSSSGERTRETPLAALSSATTSSTTALNSGLEAGSDSCSMNTDSSTVSSKPPLSTICSARRESPASASAGSRVLVPTTLPSATATTTNASHPKIAVLRWAALQRPMRAARF